MNPGRREQMKELPPTLQVYGIDFDLTADLDSFYQTAGSKGKCVLVLDMASYSNVTQEASEKFAEQYGWDSPITRNVFKGLLICRKCDVEFTEAFKFKLSGAAQAFGAGLSPKEIKCPNCGGRQAYMVYDNIHGETITEADLDAIREFERYLAKEWWKRTGREGGVCDRCCFRDIPKGGGYLCGSNMLCEDCYNKDRGPNALKELQKNPDYYGNALVRKARHFVASGSVSIIKQV
jgi:hypothetical protein